MSRTVVIIGCIALCVVGVAWNVYAVDQAHIARAAAPGEALNWIAAAQTIVSYLMAYGGGAGAVIATVLSLLNKGAGALTTGTTKDAATVAIDWAGVLLYSNRYKASTNPSERAALKSAAVALDSQNIALLFPDDGGAK